jgi:TonB family protein
VVYRLSETGEGTVLDGREQQQTEWIDRIKVSGNLKPFMLVKQVQPKYPKAAKKAGIQGTVVLHVIIAKDGTVKEVTYVSGPPELSQSAIDAVQQWQYQRTVVNGHPVEIDAHVSIIFTLGN